jgi:SAM-dependent methyltransferase
MKPESHSIAENMRREWDERAKTNARHYVATGKTDWSDEEFFHSGQVAIDEIVLNDLGEICRGRKPAEMQVLEIGCGIGRLTYALSKIFCSIDAVDVSSEMIAQARSALSSRSNIRFHVNNGMDLSIFADNSFDFALSYIVFQHIPRKAIVERYIRETFRVLRRNSLFRFQVQGCPIPEDQADTWVGVGFSEADIAEYARMSGFHIQNSFGAGTQYYWITFLKP